jgi:hypothetical protein
MIAVGSICKGQIKAIDLPFSSRKKTGVDYFLFSMVNRFKQTCISLHASHYL